MKKKNILATLLFATASLSLLTACSNGGTQSASTSEKKDLTPYGKYEKSVTFTIGIKKLPGLTIPEGQTLEENTATKYVEKMVNVHSKVDWEVQDMDQKISLAISTGKIPDVMIVDRNQFKQLVDNDLIADMTDVYKKTASKNLKTIYSDYGERLMKQVTVDGKMMGVPSTAYKGEQDILWIRKDWLTKLGKALPQTEQEVYDLAQEFVDKDMAGNGKTVGLTMNSKVAGGYASGYSLNPIFYANHSYPRQWIEKDGKEVYGTVQPETKKTLEKLAREYKAGALDKEFAIRKSEDLTGLVSSGRAGMLFFPWWAPYSDIQKTLANDPNADWIPVSAPLDTEEKFNVPQNDPLNQIVVVRKGFEHPEAVMKSINLTQDFLFQLTPEAKKYVSKELPNAKARWSHSLTQIPVSISNDDPLENYAPLKAAINQGDAIKLAEERPDLMPAYKNYELLKEKGLKADLVAWGDITARITGKEASALDKNLTYISEDFYGTTKTMKSSQVNLTKLEDEMFVKIISGEEPISYFETFVKQWKEMGGTQITEEVNEQTGHSK
jgi:putative aldouronate transport system substrate-binding protein